MAGQFWLGDEQVERLRLPFPKPRGKARVDDRRVLSGILRSAQRPAQGPALAGCASRLRSAQDASHNRFVRWSRPGVFARIFRDLVRPGAEGDTIMIDSTHLKAHRTAASLETKGGRGRGPSGARKAA